MSVIDLDALRDGCPACVLTVTRPVLATRRGEQIDAVYVCPLCDHLWTCIWNTDALGEDPSQPDAA